jgi:hypothetical protein
MSTTDGADVPDRIQSLDPAETVIVGSARTRGGRENVYHTTAACPTVRHEIASPMPRPRSHLNDRWRECHYCRARRDGGDTPLQPQGVVSPSECQRIRTGLRADASTRGLAAELGVARATIQSHARGDCACAPDAPVLTYDRAAGAWVPDEGGDA